MELFSLEKGFLDKLTSVAGIMKKSHNCKEVVSQFNLMLDGELNPKEEQDVMCELQRCMHCLEEYNLEEKYRKFIQERVEKKCCPSAFLNKIKTKVQQSRDED